MALELENFGDELDAEYVAYLLDEQAADSAMHYGRLWDYFRNPLIPSSVASGSMCAKPYIQAQEMGLPTRITGVSRTHAGRQQMTDLRRKEVVIENDIAWRIGAMIDFLFGKPVQIRSKAKDAALARTIEAVASALLEGSGGIGFLQEMALLGSVYGFVDIALRTPADGPAASHTLPVTTGRLDAELDRLRDRPGTSDISPAAPSGGPHATDAGSGPVGDRSRTLLQRAVAAARLLTLETVEAPRVLPILAEDDYRRVRFWVQKYERRPARLGASRRTWLGALLGGRQGASPEVVETVEIIGPRWWQRYDDRQLVDEGPNPLGRLPVVHVQNVALPGGYEGLGDVEPLIPLQDELNTRLSDRASRVTYQSFKMYLGKGIDDFLDRPVGPGQMWATHNLQASIEEFGSDTGSPSEDAHVEQVRQALDKVSGVTPLAAGLISGNLGNLTSATALKVVLSGLLARTAKKRLTYGAGLQQIIELALAWLDVTGALRTVPEDRLIEVHWPSPLPVDEGEQLRNAQIKAQLGVPRDRLLAELGYDRSE